MANVIQKLCSAPGKALVYLATLACLPLAAQQTPPKDLLARVAEQGSLFEKERAQYTYRQTFHFFELDRRGVRAGDYFEMRDVLFNTFGPRLGLTRDESNFAADEAFKALERFDADVQDKGKAILEQMKAYLESAHAATK